MDEIMVGGRQPQKLQEIARSALPEGAAKDSSLQTLITGQTTQTSTQATSELQTTLNNLTETLQELVARLEVLASMANSGPPAIRTIPIASVSTAVTGTVAVSTAATVTNLTNFGTSIPASEMAHDVNNSTAILANINNVVI
jgi:U3 small nucleolar ribonucleoprotein component